MNLQTTAIPMESAAFFALPRPVSEAESVSTPARNTEESDVIRTRRMSVSLSASARRGYKKFTMGPENAKRTSANGSERRIVRRSAYIARRPPSSLFEERETSGTVAATRP